MIWIKKNELYHYGVKGMKWGKRKKKMSEAERQARVEEGLARQRDEARQKYLLSKENRSDAYKSEKELKNDHKRLANFNRYASFSQGHYGLMKGTNYDDNGKPSSFTVRHDDKGYTTGMKRSEKQAESHTRRAEFETRKAFKAYQKASGKSYKAMQKRKFTKKKTIKSYVKNLFKRKKK